MSVTPTFDGQAIFGVNCRMSSTENPREVQVNAFFGLDGVEELDGGDRGRSWQISGLLFGLDLALLTLAEAQLRAYKDGKVHTLFTTRGETWSNVKLTDLEIGGFSTTVDGTVYSQYKATLKQLL